MYPSMQIQSKGTEFVASIVNGRDVQQQDANAPSGALSVVPANTPYIYRQFPIHPDVRFKKLPFYEMLAVLIQPSTLTPKSAQRIQEVSFCFTLTPQQATEVASNRDIRNIPSNQHPVQVQVRFCLLNTTCEQDDCLPSNIAIKVNNKVCPLPNALPQARPHMEPKRTPRPINVTSNVKLSPIVTNNITVQWTPDNAHMYCMGVFLVRKLTSVSLLERLKAKAVTPLEYTRSLIKEKLREDADCEISTTMLKVSLNCPLGKMKMTIPCRASTCSHLQCFDAKLYLQMNERKPTWRCPVCNKPALYETLVIDGYFHEVLEIEKRINLSADACSEIQLHKDGSWSIPSVRDETMLDMQNKSINNIEQFPNNISIIANAMPPTSINDTANSNKNEKPQTKSMELTSTIQLETVDLTMSESDDDAKQTPVVNNLHRLDGQPLISHMSNSGCDRVNVCNDCDEGRHIGCDGNIANIQDTLHSFSHQLFNE